MKEKICFVIQRYGLEVNGGAELHCRQLAEHMKDLYKEVHIVTTKAVDHLTWKNEYIKDEEIINGIIVHRFPVIYERNLDEFNAINAIFLSGRLEKNREQEWLHKQGPVSPGMIKWLRDNDSEFDAFIFFTYLYYHAVMGIPEVASKAIVIPTAHDEPYLGMQIFENVFTLPKAFLYNTEEERQLINKVFNNKNIPSLLGGVGVEFPAKLDPEGFKKKYKLNDYIIYVGRIEEGKKCHILFQYFQEYKLRNKNNNCKLVLVGKPLIPIPKDEDIISLGFLEKEQDKFDGIKGAKALIMPSEFESLSMVVLEAMCVGTPVIVNGKCEVLKGHCSKSNGAFYYNNYFEFEAELNYILTHEDEVEIMTYNAKKYVDENYKWDVITERLSQLIESI